MIHQPLSADGVHPQISLSLRFDEKFLLSHSVFYLFRDLSSVFMKFKIVVSKPFQFVRVLKLSSGKGLILITAVVLMIWVVGNKE